MVKKADKEAAIQLRIQGMSYSQIKERLGISKSTLSGWLAEYPLSEERLQALRDKSPVRIERYRATMQRKRKEREQLAFEKIKKDIKALSDRELFLAGLFLYWGEGTKTAPYTTCVSNTDPAVLKFFISWLELLGVDKSKVSVKLHIYDDMVERQEKLFWSRELNIPLKNFSSSYIKRSSSSGLTYKNGYGHGTCNVRVYNRDLSEYILMGLKYLREMSDNMRP
jgi:transcriptional regulator with XRE-family HTH domain